MSNEYDFTEEELRTWRRRDAYFVELLNGTKSLEEVREDLASFRGGKWYTGDNPKYKLPGADETNENLNKLTIRRTPTKNLNPESKSKSTKKGIE